MSATMARTTRGPFAVRLRECAAHSSIKYLPKLVGAKSVLHSILWLIAMALGVSEGLFLLYKLWKSYFAREVTISIVSMDGGRPPFPDVTVCNLNLLWNNGPDWGLLARVDGIPERLTYDRYINMFYGTKRGVNVSGFEGTNQQLSSASGYLKHTQYAREKALLDHLGKTFVWKCFWQTHDYAKDCTVIPVVTPTNGLCYTIRPPPGEGIRVKTRQEGLSVILFLNNTDLRFVADYRINPFQTYTEGAKIVVHSRGTVPEMAEGFIVSPGIEALIVAKYFKRTMLPSPYSNCQDDLRLDMFDHIEAKDLWNYTQYACRSLYFQDQIIEDCNCLDSTEITFIELIDKYRFCIALTKENIGHLISDVNCIKNTRVKLVTNETIHDKCPVPCERDYYTSTVNQVSWPDELYILALYNSYLKSDGLPPQFDYYYGTAFDLMMKGNTTEAMQIVSSTNLMQKNFLQLSVTMNDAITFEEDNVAVTLSSVFGSLGGILNLWIGFTLITIMEIIDFFLTISMDKCCSNKLYEGKDVRERVNSNQAYSVSSELSTVSESTRQSSHVIPQNTDCQLKAFYKNV